MLTTGTKQAIATAPKDYYFHLVRYSEKLCQEFPSQNLH